METGNITEKVKSKIESINPYREEGKVARAIEIANIPPSVRHVFVGCRGYHVDVVNFKTAKKETYSALYWPMGSASPSVRALQQTREDSGP